MHEQAAQLLLRSKYGISQPGNSFLHKFQIIWMNARLFFFFRVYSLLQAKQEKLYSHGLMSFYVTKKWKGIHGMCGLENCKFKTRIFYQWNETYQSYHHWYFSWKNGTVFVMNWHRGSWFNWRLIILCSG